MNPHILQLKITLKNTKPAIYRVVQVPADFNFYQLHYVIQIAMGWDVAHMHEFRIKHHRISELFDEVDDQWADGVIDSKTVMVGLTVSKGDKFIYEYDFGDSWVHEIKVEKVFEAEESVFYPTCIDGAMACPPEDCGSIPGYYRIIEIMNGKKDDEYEEMVEWLGEPFEADKFDIKMVNDIFEDVFKPKVKKKRKK